MEILKLEKRTFGLELEVSDVDTGKMEIPRGYSWSKDEIITNTNGKKSPPANPISGELNTKPLHLTRKDIRELRTTIRSFKKYGGHFVWAGGFDGHIYIGDTGLEELKKFFALGFYVSPLLNKIFKLGEWFDVEHLVPAQTYEFCEKVEQAKTVEELKNVFANSSNRGHYRFQINIMSYFKTGTIEFRIFNCTDNFRETLETIKFMYNFVDYALTKDMRDFRKIETEEDFFREFKIGREFTKATPPLVFAESHLENTRQISKAFGLSRRLMSVVKQATQKEIVTVNPYYYELETGLYKDKKVHIKNNLEFNNILYQIAQKGLIIEYKENYSILNEYKDNTVENELIMFLIFHRIHKYNIETEYGEKEFKAYIEALDKSIEKIRDFARELIEMFNNVVYEVGGINEALEEDMDIVFLQEPNSKANSTVTALGKHTDYKDVFVKKQVNYYDIDKHIKKDLFIASKNEFLPYTKIAKDMDIILYSTQKSYLGVRQVVEKQYNTTIKTPPDNYEITEKTKIKVQEVRPTFFSEIQRRFVKKVSKFTRPRFCYTITADEYVLGAFGFEFEKNDANRLFLLSDFCTNNNIRLLSKLILFIIRTKEVKRLVERKRVGKVENGYTKVYTTRPVSMKYRGAFKKVKTQDKNSLVYEFTFGDIVSIQDAIREYVRRKAK